MKRGDEYMGFVKLFNFYTCSSHKILTCIPLDLVFCKVTYAQRMFIRDYIYLIEKAKQSIHLTKEWVNKLWHTHWTEYYEVFKNHVFKKYLMTLKNIIYILYKNIGYRPIVYSMIPFCLK